MLVCFCCVEIVGENEANVRHLLDSYSFMRLVDHIPRVGGPGLTGPLGSPRARSSHAHADQGPSAANSTPAAALWSGAWLSEKEAALVQRFDPTALETIGFFLAKFQKVASCLPHVQQHQHSYYTSRGAYKRVG